jgi:hypothetical protein
MEIERQEIIKSVHVKKEVKSLERRDPVSSAEGIDIFSKLVDNLYASGKQSVTFRPNIGKQEVFKEPEQAAARPKFVPNIASAAQASRKHVII